MALNPTLHEMVARAVDSGKRSLARREVLTMAIAEEIYSVAPDDADLDVLALTDTIVDRLELMGVDLPSLASGFGRQRSFACKAPRIIEGPQDKPCGPSVL